MTCPVDLWAEVLRSSQLGLITQKQREDLHHLILLGDDHLAAEGLKRLKESHNSNQKVFHHRRSKHG